MNERSFICARLMSSTPIRAQPSIAATQILEAAMVCFAKRGFHQTSMHDISAEAGISVGLIYRYFENKEAVISAMADRHKKEIHDVLERARQAPTLLESLEILFTAHCCENSPQSSVRLRGRSLRGSIPQPAGGGSGARRFADGDGRRDRSDRALAGSAEVRAHGLTPNEMAELIFAVARGMLMRDVLQPPGTDRRGTARRGNWKSRAAFGGCCFKPETEPAYA